MISAPTLCVCREGKPISTPSTGQAFSDHAPGFAVFAIASGAIACVSSNRVSWRPGLLVVPLAALIAVRFSTIAHRHRRPRRSRVVVGGRSIAIGPPPDAAIAPRERPGSIARIPGSIARIPGSIARIRGTRIPVTAAVQTNGPGVASHDIFPFDIPALVHAAVPHAAAATAWPTAAWPTAA